MQTIRPRLPLTRVSPRQMAPHWSEAFGNPHSNDHVIGWRAADAVRGAIRIGREPSSGLTPDEIVFTSGATEANNLALLGTRDAALLRIGGASS